MDKGKKNPGDPAASDQLSGFDMRINSFGEIINNLGIDKINAFLDENLDDKKLAGRNLSEEEE